MDRPRADPWKGIQGIQVTSQATPNRFDALVAMQFLDCAGDVPSARYFNTTAGVLYLDRGSPRYVGGWLVASNALR